MERKKKLYPGNEQKAVSFGKCIHKFVGYILCCTIMFPSIHNKTIFHERSKLTNFFMRVREKQKYS